MYRPSLRPGEELVKTSPGVNVKNVSFDAFLTSKRIIFVKRTDSLQEKKELVFPLNLVRDFQPSSDESGTPDIRFSIEKPSGEVGDLIMKFIQTGDYRYSERDDWIEDLKSLSRGIVPGHAAGGARGQMGGHEPFPGVVPPAPRSPPAYSRDEELFSAGPGDTRVPPSAGFRQPPQAPPAPPAPPAAPRSPPAEERYSMPQAPQAPQTPPPPPGAGQQQTQFCRFCGAKVLSGSAFCPSCGRKLEQQPEVNRQSFSQAPQTPPPAPQAPSAGHQPFTTPPPVHQGGDNRGFVSPPPPPQSTGRSGYPPRHEGGMSLADDRAYARGPGGQVSPKSQKAMMKEQAKADKARMKEQAKAEKEQRKAMKKAQKGGYGGYNDPYGYRESRMPEPKIIIMIVAVIAVIAVVGFAFSNGMIGGGGGTTTDTSSSGSQSSSTTTTTNEPGTTTVSESFGNWFFEVLYSGDWSGTYTYNGQTNTISGFGYQKSPNIVDPSGTISISIQKTDGESGKIMDVTLYDSKSKPVESVTSSTDAGETVTIDYAVS